MNIQKLEEKHQIIIGESDLNYPEYLMEGLTKQQQFERYEKEEELVAKEATKLSVEFAIDILKDLNKLYETLPGKRDAWHYIQYNNLKIQELKTYLDEKIL